MTITLSDIKRALTHGGDVSAATGFWQKALGNPPVPCLASFIQPTPLPESTAFLKSLNSGLDVLVNEWLEANESEAPSKLEGDVTVVGLPPYGKNVASYLARVINEVKPEIIAIDATPVELSAHALYAMSVPSAVGLPQQAEIMGRDLGLFYAGFTFNPGDVNETAIFLSWRKKIPLFPVGIPVKKARYSDIDFMMAFIDESQADKELSKPAIFNAYRSLDEKLKGARSLNGGIKHMKNVASVFSASIGSKMREILVDEACYIVSRIADCIACANSKGIKGRILVITDITRYQDIDYTMGLTGKGVMEELYVPPQRDVIPQDMVLIGKESSKLLVDSQGIIPESTVIQKLFISAFNRYAKKTGNENLSEAEIDNFISQIAGRTRLHDDILHGASVRGTIALREVLNGLSTMRGTRSRDAIHRSALITLTPRITAKQAGSEQAIIEDITREVLYGIHLSREDGVQAPDGSFKWLSPEDLANALKNLKPVKESDMKEMPHRRLPAAVVADPTQNKEMLKLLESKKLLKKGTEDQYTLTKKAIEYLLNELDEKLRKGEITQEEYNRQKSRLNEMLKAATQPRFKMSAKDLANTIMEIMDAQDKQWNSEVSFERLNVYYHIKANAELGEVSTKKRDYYGLKTLIDDLDKQGLLSLAEDASSEFTLTGEALDLLLDYLISRDPKGRGLKSAMEAGKALVHERKHEVRRYSSGDVFRDISVRHTLKEIARKKKELDRVTKDDFRVFMKQHRELQSDIVLCMDVSGSMGFQHKLMYARLAASGLAKAAIDNKDRVGVVAFNNTGQTTMPITGKNKEAVLDYIVKLSARGNTNIGDGIRVATDLLFADHSHNQKFLVLVTDGEPTAISQRAFDRLKEVKEKDLTEESAILEARKSAGRGVKISVIHIAGMNEPSGEFIRKIARIGKGNVRRISSADDIRAIMR